MMEEATPDDLPDLEQQLSKLAARQERLRESAAELARQMEKQQ